METGSDLHSKCSRESPRDTWKPRRSKSGECTTFLDHPHIHKTTLQIFPCLTKVNIWCRRRGSNLYHTGRAEFELYKKVWVLDKPRLLLYRDLDTGYPSSQRRISKFKWPHDQLHSVSTGLESAIYEFIVSKLFCPWLLFITSNIYIKILLVLFSLTVFNMLQLTAAFLLYRKTVRKLQGLSNQLMCVASVSARVRRESYYAGYTNRLEKF